jgi:lysophospholipase L1-like esterase
MLFEPGNRIVFIGDSITDAGRRTEYPPYGNGYVNLIRAFVAARYPELRLSWVNHGLSGDTVRDLAARWERDAISARPDWLSVNIGINDVRRAFDGDPAAAVPIDEYESTLRSLLRRAVDATGCRLILAEPYLIEPDRGEAQRAESDRYGLVVRGLAVEFDAVNVPTQEAFDRVLEASRPTDWAPDRIHPDLPGHAVIAQAYLSALDWSLLPRQVSAHRRLDQSTK